MKLIFFMILSTNILDRKNGKNFKIYLTSVFLLLLLLLVLFLLLRLLKNLDVLLQGFHLHRVIQ